MAIEFETLGQKIERLEANERRYRGVLSVVADLRKMQRDFERGNPVDPLEMTRLGKVIDAALVEAGIT